MHDLGWNIVGAAGAQSTLAGVLAGFVFTAIVTLLSNPPKTDAGRKVSSNVYLLLVTFLSLLVVSYLFAALAGNALETPNPSQPPNARPFVEGIFASPGFALAVLLMVLSILRLIHEYGAGLSNSGHEAILFRGTIVVAIVSVVSTMVPAASLVFALSDVAIVGCYAVGVVLSLIPMTIARMGAARRLLAKLRNERTVTSSLVYAILMALCYAIASDAPKEAFSPTDHSSVYLWSLVALALVSLLGLTLLACQYSVILGDSLPEGSPGTAGQEE